VGETIFENPGRRTAMLIEIHAIQNHSPANLNRDDLGAPKTCYFGGVLRSRISSQCIKRSIRMSEGFKRLLGGVRTRRLAQLIARNDTDSNEFKRAIDVLKECGIAPKEQKKKNANDDDASKDEDKSAGLVYVSRKAVDEMSRLLRDGKKTNEELSKEFAKLIASHTATPDMALFGRMLEPKRMLKPKKKDVWKGLDSTVEASLQVAHAISTHEARPEVDYYVAVDDVSGEDAGAGYVDEAMFASACFYKYFSIHWETLVENLKGFGVDHEKLAAHTVGAFIRGAAMVNPTGKQNSFAAHNPPDGMLVEIKNTPISYANNTPISYANAFAKPAGTSGGDIISQSIAQLGRYVRDMDTGYGKPTERFWFSPNLRYPLSVIEDKKDIHSLDELIRAVVKAIGHDWEEVKKIVVNAEVA
jgi:CRISPR system Cascade subunit CasC